MVTTRNVSKISMSLSLLSEKDIKVEMKGWKGGISQSLFILTGKKNVLFWYELKVELGVRIREYFAILLVVFGYAKKSSTGSGLLSSMLITFPVD